MNRLHVRAFENALLSGIRDLAEAGEIGATCTVSEQAVFGDAADETRPKDALETLDTCVRSRWVFGSVGYPIKNSGLDVDAWVFSVNLASADLVCRQCGGQAASTHDSGWRGLGETLPAWEFDRRGSGDVVQVFSIPYQCRACRGEPIVFQFRRQAAELQLTGRTQ